MDQIQRKPDWWFYIAWVGMSLICAPVAFLLSFGIISIVTKIVGGQIVVGGQTRITEDFLLLYVLLPLIGFTLGLLQYLLLSRYVGVSYRWIGATTIGWCMPILSGLLLSRVFPSDIDPYSMGYLLLWVLLIGFWIGFWQWLILRGRVRYSSTWIPANMVAWGITGTLTGNTLDRLTEIVMVFLLPGLVTACTLWLLLQLSMPKGEQAV